MRDRYGPPEVVEVRDVDAPAPKADEVLVRMWRLPRSTGRISTGCTRAGRSPGCSWACVRRQKSVGLDVAGTVEAVGPGVTRFSLGDRVFGDMFASGVGAFAEYVCAPSAHSRSRPMACRSRAATLPRLGDPCDPGPPAA